MPTFPDHSPDLDSTYEREELLLHAPFGDGYYQSTGDGIRPYSDSWDVGFTGRPLSVITEIKTFLDGLNGETFDWQSPLDASVKKWKYVDKYKVGKQGPDAFSISFKIIGVTA